MNESPRELEESSEFEYKVELDCKEQEIKQLKQQLEESKAWCIQKTKECSELSEMNVSIETKLTDMINPFFQAVNQ